MPDVIRVAVIGSGAFGRNHLRVFHELASHAQPASAATFSSTQAPEPPLESALRTAGSPGVQLVAVVDADSSRRAQASSTYGIPAFATVEDLLSSGLPLDAATIAVPTRAHSAMARQLLSANLDVLVEKPLTATLAEADELITLAAARHRILAAGHLERFNPCVTAAFQRLTRPMFFEAHRLSVFTPRSLDVDVVLDLMIHDLDILLAMAASSVKEIRAVGLPVLSRNVDIANVRLEFHSGAVANLTASRVSTEQIRKLRFFQPSQYLSLDYARQELLTIHVDPKHASASAQPHPSAGLSFEKLNLPRAEPLRLELEDFLHAVASRTPPRVTGQAAREALALALAITEEIATHANRTGLPVF